MRCCLEAMEGETDQEEQSIDTRKSKSPCHVTYKVSGKVSEILMAPFLLTSKGFSKAKAYCYGKDKGSVEMVNKVSNLTSLEENDSQYI